MSNNTLEVVERDLASISLDRVVKYSSMLDSIPQAANTMNAPLYLRDMIMAMDVTSELMADAIRAHGKAEAAYKEAEAIAFLDHAGQYLADNKIKDSAEARKRYVPLDDDVKAAADMRAKTEALVTLLKNKWLSFRMAHDDVKKMAYASDYMNNSPSEA